MNVTSHCLDLRTSDINFLGGGAGNGCTFGTPGRRYPICMSNIHLLGICMSNVHLLGIRESVDSLCRDGADAQYMQYLSKSRITSPQTR